MCWTNKAPDLDPSLQRAARGKAMMLTLNQTGRAETSVSVSGLARQDNDEEKIRGRSQGEVGKRSGEM